MASGYQSQDLSQGEGVFDDFDFSFAGLVGKVRLIRDHKCAVADGTICCFQVTDIPDDVDNGYFMVSFNDGRTSYPFLARHLQVDQGDGNYEVNGGLPNFLN